MTAPTEIRRRGLPLRQRLIISSLLGVLPLIALGIVLLLGRYYSQRALIMQHNRAQAKLAAAYVLGWLEGHLNTLRSIVSSNEIRSGNRAAIQGLVERQQRVQQEWDYLSVSNASGQIIATSAPRMYDVSNRAYFQQAKRTLQPVITNLLTSQVTGQPVIVIAYPIIRNGAFQGIVAAAISPKQIQQVFASVAAGSPNVVSLWGSDGRLIAHTMVPPGQEYLFVDGKGVLNNGSGTRIMRNKATHELVLVGYAPVTTAHWTVITSTPLRVAFLSVRRMMVIFIVVAALALAATLLWSIYSAGVIARQVRLLAESARAIGEGHFDHRVSLKTGDELEDLANSLNKMADDLLVLDRLKSDLLSMVSHELKTPLTSIRTSLDVLSSGMVAPDDPHYRELFEIATRQTRRLQDMIENLISVARMQAGGFAIVPQPTLLTSILTASAQLYEGVARERGLEFLVEAPPDIRVMADAPKVTLALNNLLDNAIKFTDTGSIIVRARKQGHEAVVTVTDTGIGIAPDVRPHLFEKFYQAEPVLTRKAGGAGLGLLVVKSIIEAHGGHVIVESAGPGQGSTFGFTLPLAENAPSA